MRVESVGNVVAIAGVMGAVTKGWYDAMGPGREKMRTRTLQKRADLDNALLESTLDPTKMLDCIEAVVKTNENRKGLKSYAFEIKTSKDAKLPYMISGKLGRKGMKLTAMCTNRERKVTYSLLRNKSGTTIVDSEIFDNGVLINSYHFDSSTGEIQDTLGVIVAARELGAVFLAALPAEVA